jgi:hypothetical protein
VARHWFTSSSPCHDAEPDEREKKRLNERNLKLGNSTLTQRKKTTRRRLLTLAQL